MARFVFAALVAALLFPPAVVADWPVFRGDPLMSGSGNAKLPDQLEVKWEFDPKTKDGGTEGAPAVVGGVVYFASLDKHLYAIDLATGKEKWKTKLGAMKAAPAVRDGRVYVGTLDSAFHCVSAADGKPVWKFETEGEITAGANFHGANVLFGCHDSHLYCLSADGKKVWAAKVEGPIAAAAAVVGDTTFATGCSDGVLRAFDAKTGKELGALELGGETVTTAAIAGDRVYQSMISNSVVSGSVKDLKKQWAFAPAARQQPFYSSAAVADGVVVAGSRDKRLYAIEAATGKQLWSFAAAGQIDASPVIVNGRVYVGSCDDDGFFYTLDLKTGKELNKLKLDAAVTGSAAVGPDCLVVGTDRGTLFCLGKK